MGVSEAKVVLALSYLNGRSQLDQPLGYNALSRASRIGSNHLSRVLPRLRGVVLGVSKGYQLLVDERNAARIMGMMLSADDNLLHRFLTSDLHIDWLHRPTFSTLIVSRAAARILCGATGWTDEALDTIMPELPQGLRDTIRRKDVGNTARQLWTQTSRRPPLVKRHVPEKEGGFVWLAAFLSPRFYRFVWGQKPWPGQIVRRDDGAYRIWVHRTENPEPLDQMLGSANLAETLLALGSLWLQEDTGRFPDAMAALDRLYHQPVQFSGRISFNSFEATFDVGRGLQIREPSGNDRSSAPSNQP